jgi:glycerophosphoryl diester phosphodiesterase
LTHPFLEGPTPIAFAHRGGSATDENGLSAFRAAFELGYRYMETDVRATRDGVAFVFHDERLERMTGCDRAIADLSAAEMKLLTLPGGEEVPTLRETLETFPQLRFNLDLKADTAVGPAAAAIEDTGAQRRVCVTSFSESRVAAARDRLGPSVCTGLGIAGVLRVGLGSILARRGTDWCQGASVLQIPDRWRGIPVLTAQLVRRAHDLGLSLHVWTLNDRAAIERALDKGVDGVMTDRPRLLKEVLLARGLWKPRGDLRADSAPPAGEELA